MLHQGDPFSLQNLFSVLEQTQRSYPLKRGYHYKEGQHYRAWTFSQIYHYSLYFGLALQELGLQKGQRCAILSQNRPEWVIADMAILSFGAVSVPIYPTLAEKEVSEILQNAEAKFLLLESEKDLERLEGLDKTCPDLERIICFHAPSPSQSHLSFTSLIEQGKSLESLKKEDYLKARRQVKRSDWATLVYTSGSTGRFKGVILTHGNLLSNMEGFLRKKIIQSDDIALSILPLSHIFERTVGFYSFLYKGVCIYYAQNSQTLLEDIQQVRPTLMIGVPRFFEKVQKGILNQLGCFKYGVFQGALKIARQYHENKKTKSLNFWKWPYVIVDFFIFRRLRSKLALNRLRLFGSGGAPLSKSLAAFFEDLGLIIVEGYGLTESSPVICMNKNTSYKLGTVGKPLKDVEIKLAQDGELLTRGPHVMQGYYKLPEETKRALTDDGWLRTGDIASIDEEGWVSIIDQKKEILVLSNGKNVAPVSIEKKILASRFISQCVVIGDNYNYLTALIVPNLMALEKKFSSLIFPQGIKNKKIKSFYTHCLEECLLNVASYEKIKKFCLLERELSFEEGELTPTMKLKRKEITKKYAQLIDSMYQES